MSFNLFLISKYRTHLMGFAALMIIICHSSVYIVSMPYLVRLIFNLGNLGVDIFLLLSGVGCYHSLCKCDNFNVFFLKRFIRIFIPYTLVSCIFLFLPVLFSEKSLKDSLYVYSTLSYWINHRGVWYVALLIPLYILAPVLFITLKTSKYKGLITLVAILIIQIFCHIKINTEYIILNDIINNIQWAFKRTVSFVIGMYIAPMIQGQKSLKNTGLFCICCCMIIIWQRFFYKNIFLGWVLVPIIIIGLCLLLDRLSYKNVFCQLTIWLGGISLESYLTNMYLCGAMTRIIILLGLQSYIHSSYTEYFFIVVFGLALSQIINNLSAKLIYWCKIKYFHGMV